MELPELERHLYSLSIDDLKQFTAALEKEIDEKTALLDGTCADNRAILTSAQSQLAVDRERLGVLQTSIASFPAKFRQLKASLQDYSKQMQSFGKEQSKHEHASLTKNMMKDFAEIPWLMETCIRNGHYNEALELHGYIDRVLNASGRFPGDLKDTSTLILLVSHEAHRMIGVMVVHLLEALSVPSKLITTMRIIGTLRQLNWLDEADIRMLLLRCRSSHFQHEVKSLGPHQSDAAEYLERYLGLAQEIVLETIVQFRSIFLGKSVAHAAANDAGSTKLILADFCREFAFGVEETFRCGVPAIDDPNSLAHLHTLVHSCSQLFARHGLDFGRTIDPIFESRVKTIFHDRIQSGYHVFADTLRYVASSKDTAFHYLISVDYQRPSGSNGMGDALLPPQELLCFPCLARLLNSYLDAMNTLRIFAPTRTLADIRASMVKSLASSAKELQDWRIPGDKGRHKEVYGRLWQAFVSLLVPSVCRFWNSGLLAQADSAIKAEHALDPEGLISSRFPKDGD